MRTTFSSVAFLASSLLAREVLAAPHNHNLMHKRAYVTDIVMVTEEVVITADADGNYVTNPATPIGTATITPVIVSSSSPSATPSSSSSSSEAPSTSASPVSSSTSAAAVFIQKPASSSYSAPETTAQPATSAPAVVSVAPVVPTTLQTATSSAAPASSPASNSGKKRGLAYNNASLLSSFLFSNSLVSWAYNWGSSTSQIPSGLEYVPILWGMSGTFTSAWNSAANAALASGSTHLMSFNEPDYSGQADLSVSDAVSGYMQYMQPFASKAKIGTPAVTNGGSPMGLTYLGNFISGLEKAGGSYDFCAIHWYSPASDPDAFKTYMQQAANTCGKPIWITEFGATGSDDEQNTFLQTVLPWLDEQSFVERYAYFMVANGNLVADVGSALSTLGSTFASFT